MATPFVKNDPRINRKGRLKKGQTLTDILDWALDQKRKIKNEETGEEKSVASWIKVVTRGEERWEK